MIARLESSLHLQYLFGNFASLIVRQIPLPDLSCFDNKISNLNSIVYYFDPSNDE